jgi:hypothetical protein
MITPGKRQKVKTYFLPVQKSKKGQAKLVLFWSKGNATPSPSWFFVGFPQLEGEAQAFLPTQTHPAKSKELFFDAHFAGKPA